MSFRSGNFEGTSFELAGNDGLPVVGLIHGLGLTRSTWDALVEPLSADYQLLLYDLYGHGQSSLPPEMPSLKLYAAQLHELVQHLGLGPVAAVGFSLGGMINRRLAMDFPESVNSLVILNSPHERGEVAQAAVEQRARDSAKAGPSANLDQTLQRWFTPEFRRSRPDVVGQIADWVVANDAKAYADSRFVLANGVVELIRPEPPITLPTLVVTCENDSGSTPAMAEGIAAEIPGAELEIIEDLQHLGLIERPEVFVGLIRRFLAQIPRAR